MATNTQTQEIKVPVLPESVQDATIATWHKAPGEWVRRDEKIVDIETDKVVLEVVAPFDGSIKTILKPQGSVVGAEEVIALFQAGASATVVPKEPIEKPKAQSEITPETQKFTTPRSPSERRKTAEAEWPTTPEPASFEKPVSAQAPAPAAPAPTQTHTDGRIEKRVPMSRLRLRIAERLLEAQQTAAILTTFNEINMHSVMDLRQKYKEIFEKTHGTRLGLMSFFVAATVEALKHFPIINASIEGQEIVYHEYYDIGIAVSSPRGLVVPIIRNAETLTMPAVEKQISLYSQKAKEGQLAIEELQGGTFTITNGGVFGSLMTTPILNPPQSGILGMHKIEERPIVEKGTIVIRPMMYVALSYDHRLIDGSESVRFLVTIKEILEDPERLLLGI